ncbi:MAG: PhoH family protein [Slackia sp.]
MLHTIQKAFAARITVRGNLVMLSGDSLEVQSLTALFGDLIKMAASGAAPTVEDAERAVELLRQGEFAPSLLREDILLTYRGRAIRPKTAGQKHYVDAIRSHTVTFGIGPAGTGKTYLAMAMAVAALKRKDVNRIILTRPVVEAGENLGFLPGTLTEKVDPYIRPLYDALFDMTDMERARELIEGGVIEIAPLAFMRGRTFNDSFIILTKLRTRPRADEDVPHPSRLQFQDGNHGDITQLDLPRGLSGLKSVQRVLDDVGGHRVCTLRPRCRQAFSCRPNRGSLRARRRAVTAVGKSARTAPMKTGRARDSAASFARCSIGRAPLM